jgi:uncharacterized protein
MAAIETPCIKICVVDPDHGICAGCGRTIAEITDWAAMSDGERRRIMTLLPDRRRAWLQPPSEP